jgi:predicted nucleic acid-binding Zn ribbon protein
MATYLFICSNCGVTKQVVAEITETVPTPFCGLCELDMERKFGIQTIRFVGDGWGKDSR